MKKRLSYFPYNERSRSGWTLSTPHHTDLSPIRSTIKTVTYVSGTFVTLVPGPYTAFQRGILFRGLLTLSGKGEGKIFERNIAGIYAANFWVRILELRFY